MTAFDQFAAIVQAHGPRTAVVLGSGLDAVPHGLEELASISFADVPGLAVPSIQGHAGRISLGRCGTWPLLVFRGRLHFYEGHSWSEVARPIHIASELGIKMLILTNAAGGILDRLWPGDLLVLRGHISWQRPFAWRQLNEPQEVVYSPRLIETLQSVEAEHGRELAVGVYAAVTGPCYETPAEIRALRTLGADVVGMSTAFEAEMAFSLGMEVAAISCITNKAAGLTPGTLGHKEVLANAAKSAERISAILFSLLERLGSVGKRP